MAAENERRARRELGYIEEVDDIYDMVEEEPSSQGTFSRLLWPHASG